jgi:hypothetical protein
MALLPGFPDQRLVAHTDTTAHGLVGNHLRILRGYSALVVSDSTTGIILALAHVFVK